MKDLLLRLSPFAPDQSGAVSVLCEMGGIIVVCDAGGCTGNICGFDEPRWRMRKSALFSAALRDMDAILGRDERLVENLKSCAERIKARFAAIIGTPVPAVIGTDFTGLGHLAERRTGMPVLTISATGTNAYDKGVESTYLELLKRFADEKAQRDPCRVAVLGATPLDLGLLTPDHLAAALRTQLARPGFLDGMDMADADALDIVVYGMGSGLEEVERAGASALNIVVSPSGIKAAKLLEQAFGTPWKMFLPEGLFPVRVREDAASLSGRKILVIHQATAAASVRERIEQTCGKESTAVTCATWFAQLPPSLRRAGDLHLTSEKDLSDTVMLGGYDCVVADSRLRKALPTYRGEWIDMPHFAVSGRLDESAEG